MASFQNFAGQTNRSPSQIRNSSRAIRQQFNYFAVIDFEVTCEANSSMPSQPYIQEIIEFPIVIIDVHKRTIVDTFQSYCRPVIKPTLSDFCKQLTGITQEKVNHAPVFTEVFTTVERWLREKGYIGSSTNKCIFVSDGCADFYKFLRMQCEISHIPYPNWANQWIDVKTVFSKLYSCRRGRIADMLNSFGLQLYGHLHSGLDDAINIGRIIIELIKNGCILLPTDSYYPSTQLHCAKSNLSTTTQIPSLFDSYDDDRMDTS